ncbi:MAG TPA: ISAzo13 family transposase [Terriglobales bacterium]|nr:ISAzo13 family transposase [Terriglobales bacterium]
MIRSKPRSLQERRWLRVLGTLNEFQARLFLASQALDQGRGGISRVSELTGMSRTTLTKAAAELDSRRKLEPSAEGRIRAAGAGRKKVEEADLQLQAELTRIVEETTAGDPMSAVRWTNKSTNAIASELTRRGHPLSDKTVARMLEEMGYTLQLNRKEKEGPQHPNRDAQFRYINRQEASFRASGDPVISVDTKKKELVGAFKNAGRTWRPKGKSYEVNVHDWPSLGKGKAIPYGVYDVQRDRAMVNVGMSHDTAEFAVESIRRWWRLDGRRRYGSARRLLICADGGGSNSSRVNAWKVNLLKLVDEIGIPITVCHYPPGTSKWNHIEHRVFSFISLTWKGQPLWNFETVINLIGATRTRSGLRVKAVLDRKRYETGVKVSAEELEKLRIRRHNTHPAWNYTILSRTS